MTLWKADDYDENSRLQQTIAKNFLELLKKRFRLDSANTQLLDIGCGSGRITPLILDSFPGVHIIGVDASKEMIDFANHHFAGNKASFHLDRAEELRTVATNSVDAITSFSCLHWVHDQQAAFQVMSRVLKPGGWMGLMFAAETGFDDPIDRVYAQTIQEEPWKGYFKQSKEVDWHIAEPKNVEAELEKMGFQVVYMGTQNFDFLFKDKAAFESWILACFQQLKLLPENLQASCSQRIAELYLQLTSSGQPEGAQCAYRVDGFMLMAIKLKY